MKQFLSGLKQDIKRRFSRKWDKIKNIPPGKRFQERYYYRKKKRKNRSQLEKIFLIVLGVAIIFVGMFLWFVPGPGWLTIFVGAAIIAGESLVVARFLDWVEIRLRKIFKNIPDADTIGRD